MTITEQEVRDVLDCRYELDGRRFVVEDMARDLTALCNRKLRWAWLRWPWQRVNPNEPSTLYMRITGRDEQGSTTWVECEQDTCGAVRWGRKS